MNSQQKLIATITSRLAEELRTSVSELLIKTIEKELATVLEDTLAESNFHKQLNEEMHDSLKGIYQEISSASNNSESSASATSELFSNTTKQLDEAMQTMLKAAEGIMALSEKLMEQQEEAGEIIACLEVPKNQEKKLARLDKINKAFEESLTEIMTSLSFQDLTGQRLQKVITAITTIRETVFELYVSTGLMVKGHSHEPKKDIKTIKEESKVIVQEMKKSELKGPTLDSSQKDVDDLLASLGM